MGVAFARAPAGFPLSGGVGRSCTQRPVSEPVSTAGELGAREPGAREPGAGELGARGRLGWVGAGLWRTSWLALAPSRPLAVALGGVALAVVLAFAGSAVAAKRAAERTGRDRLAEDGGGVARVGSGGSVSVDAAA